MATSPTCRICQAPLPSSSSRRTLDVGTSAGTNRIAVEFLVSKVHPECRLQCGSYCCKACFASLEKGAKSLQAAEDTINAIRGKLNLNPAHVAIVYPTVLTPCKPLTPTAAANSRKRDRNSDELNEDEQVEATGDVEVVRIAGRKKQRRMEQIPQLQGRRKLFSSPGNVSAASPKVQVTVARESGKVMKYQVPSRYKRIVQTLRYKKSPYTFRTIARTSGMKPHLVKLLCKDVKKECEKLTAKSSFLTCNSLSDMQKFDWRLMEEEMTKVAPTLLAVLRSASTKRNSAPDIRTVNMAAAVLMKGRNKNASFVQNVVSVLLYAGHSSKRVFKRLNKLGLCSSHQKTTRIICELGKEHDASVLQWKAAAEKREETTTARETAHSEGEKLGEPTCCEGEARGPASDERGESEESLHCDSEPLPTTGRELDSEDDDLASPVVTSDSEPESQGSVDTLQSSTSGGVSSTLDVTEESVPTDVPPSYTIVGDNIDKSVNPRFMTSEHQRQSLHYFHYYAVLDRVNSATLPDTSSTSSIDSLGPSAFFPDTNDSSQLRSNYAVLLGRVLVREVPYFQIFKKCVPDHIPHIHSHKMRQKSTVVPLGIIPENEIKTEGMIKIMDKLHTYVPRRGADCQDLHQLAFGGDALTSIRARQGINVRVNSSDPVTALRGLVPFASDWHAKVNFMSIMWKRLYKSGSSREGGTLQQLRNLINRRNIGTATSVTGHVNEVEDFLELVIKCHLLTAACQFFSMSSLSDSPHTNGFPQEVQKMNLHSRRKLFIRRLERLIDQYVLPRDSNAESSLPHHDEAEGNPHLVRIRMEHSYISLSLPRHRHLPPTVRSTLAPRPHAAPVVRKKAPDALFNYASAVLNDGLLLLEFKDAIREGDGIRILRCWKVLVMYFHYARHTNYLQEAFQILALTSGAASPMVASQLTWGRVVNTRGGRGRNIPVDLYMEHLNRAVKTYVANLGANVAESTILQCGQSLKGIMAVCEQFDDSNDIHPDSLQHSQASPKSDRDKIVHQLLESAVFQYIPGRYHDKFKNIKPNIAHSVNSKGLVDWIQMEKKKFAAGKKMAKAYGHQI